MLTCVFCKTHYEKGSGISLHKFPKDGSLVQWLNNMKLENFSPTDNDRICSKHFTAECFAKHKTRTSLKRNSIPTIFCSKMRAVSSSTSFKKEDTLNDVDTGKCSTLQLSKKKVLQDSKIIGTKKTNTYKCSPMTHDPLDDCALRRPIKKEKIHNHPCSCLTTSCNAEQNKIPLRGISQVWGSVKHDHSYQTNTPTSSKKAMEEIQNTLKTARTRIKVLSQHVKRLTSKVASLKDTNKKLRKRKVIGDVFVDMLKQSDDVKPQLFKRMFLNSDKNVSHAGYPKELKAFSLTLYALSSQAYDFVRKKFNLALPHPRVIRTWRSALNAKSGLPVENNYSAIDPSAELTSVQDDLEHNTDQEMEPANSEDEMEYLNCVRETPCEFTIDQDGMEEVNSGAESPNEFTLVQVGMEHDNESPHEFTLIQDEMEQINSANESPYKFALIQNGTKHNNSSKQCKKVTNQNRKKNNVTSKWAI